jgi:hypothetical protein
MRVLYSITPKPTKCRWWVLQSNQQQTKGKLIMGNLTEIIAVACDECGGAGFLFWGNENNYDVESCDCALESWGI